MIDLTFATDHERRFLSGAGKDIADPSYKYNRAVMERGIRERQTRCATLPRQLRDATEPERLQRCYDHLLALAASAKIHVAHDAAMPPVDGAWRSSTRTARVAPFTPHDPARGWLVVTALAHELGHGFAPRCPGTGEHRMTQHETYRCCMACEAAANELAIRFLPIGLSEGRDLEQALAIHGRSTRATTDGAARVRRFAGLWRAQLQRQTAQGVREERMQQMRQWAREAKYGD
jgi:hypothetical protein